MGLDTVELIVAVEKHFQIIIPDREAENIGTVGQAAACVSRFKGLPSDPTRTAAYHAVLQKLLTCLQVVHSSATADTLLAAIWPPGTANKAVTLADCTQLEIPPLPKFISPQQQGRITWLQRLFGSGYLSSQVPGWSGYTVADLTDWILAQNYVKLLPVPATVYEAQRVIVGITSYCSGILVSKIQLADSFTNDLGMS